ncbi:MAG: zinc ribbon domain-containing protein [Erysipelotrichaceae bacterium]|nr:zinc ribbon domain-containing protein [Erysipelotrichaceae bacterium]
MEGYRNFTVTMDHASDRCSRWKNVETGEELSYAEMMIIAAHLDSEYPLEQRSWYIVFPDGEIAILHEDFDEIMPLFLPLNNKKIVKKFTGDEFNPARFDTDTQLEINEARYCIHCGKRLVQGAIYCPHCGKKVN